MNSFRPTFRGTRRLSVFDEAANSMTVLNGAGKASEYDMSDYTPAEGASDVLSGQFRFYTSPNDKYKTLESIKCDSIFDSFSKFLTPNKELAAKFAEIDAAKEKARKLPFKESYAKGEEITAQLAKIKLSRADILQMAAGLRDKELEELRKALLFENPCIQEFDGAQFNPRYACYDRSVEPELNDIEAAKAFRPSVAKAPSKVEILQRIFKKPNTIEQK